MPDAPVRPSHEWETFPDMPDSPSHRWEAVPDAPDGEDLNNELITLIRAHWDRTTASNGHKTMAGA